MQGKIVGMLCPRVEFLIADHPIRSSLYLRQGYRRTGEVDIADLECGARLLMLCVADMMRLVKYPGV